MSRNDNYYKNNQKLTLRNRIKLLVGSIVIILVIFLFFKYIFPVVWPFALAYIVALAIEKPVKWLEKRLGGRRTLASAVIVSVLTVIIVGALGYLVYMGITEVKAFIKNYDYYMVMVRQQCARICLDVDGWFGLKDGCCMEAAERCLLGVERGIIQDGGAQVVNKVMKISMPLLTTVVLAAGALFVSVISVVYLSNVLDKIRMWRCYTVFYEETDVVTVALKQLMDVYFRIQLIIMGINSGLCIAGLILIKNPYAVVVGLLIGIVDALPIFGTGTVLIPWALILILCKKFMSASILIVLYVITYFVREIMESKCMGDRMGVAPFTMLLVIYVGFVVYGVMGFILGPVSYVVIKALIKYLYGCIKVEDF